MPAQKPKATSPAEIRRQIMTGLTHAGFVVTGAPHLTAALATLHQQAGVLVILDLMDLQAGAQLVEDLRATEGGQQPVLLCSPAERKLPERQLLE